MEIICSDIGSSEELRSQISNFDVAQTTLSFVLDKLRTVKVQTKRYTSNQLIVRCRDTEERATVILYLPYASNARAFARIITHNSPESAGA